MKAGKPSVCISCKTCRWAVSPAADSKFSTEDGAMSISFLFHTIRLYININVPAHTPTLLCMFYGAFHHAHIFDHMGNTFFSVLLNHFHDCTSHNNTVRKLRHP